MNPKINRFLYAGFVVMSIVAMIFGNWMMGFSNFGLALFFDPFDVKQPWNERPRWQRIWFLSHVAVMFAILSYGFVTDVL